MEAKVLLVQLLRRFEFAALPGVQVVPSTRGGTVKPLGGLTLSVRERQ